MFHFTQLASGPYGPPKADIQRRMIPLSRGRVAPFGNPGISACLAAPPGLSQPTTSFFAYQRQDIRPALLVADTRSLFSRLRQRHSPLTLLLFTCQRAFRLVSRPAPSAGRTRVPAMWAFQPLTPGRRQPLAQGILVEMTGIEPATSGLQSRRSPC